MKARGILCFLGVLFLTLFCGKNNIFSAQKNINPSSKTVSASQSKNNTKNIHTKQTNNNNKTNANFIVIDNVKYLTIDDVQKSLVLELYSSDSKTHNATYYKGNARIEFCAGHDYIIYNSTKIFLSKQILYREIDNKNNVKKRSLFSKLIDHRRLLISFEDYNEVLLPLLVPHLISVQHYSKTVKRIVIDAGHGGKDDGTSNKSYGLKEKDLALQVALALQKKLNSITVVNSKKQRENKYIVELTRTKDEFLELTTRSQKTNNFKADLFICIHFNSAENKNAEGIEILSYPRKSKKCSNIKPGNKNDILNLVAGYSFCSVLCPSLNEVNRGVKMQELGVLRELNVPGILIECGFLSNDKTAKKFLTTSASNHKQINKTTNTQTYIVNTEYINKIVDALTCGIEKYNKNLSLFK